MASKWQRKNPTHALLSHKTKANASRTCFLRARKFELLLFKTQYPSGDFSFGLRKSLGPREMRLDRASAASFKRQLRPTVGKAVHDNGTYISPGLGGTVAQSTLQAADPRGTCESHAFIGLRQTS